MLSIQSMSRRKGRNPSDLLSPYFSAALPPHPKQFNQSLRRRERLEIRLREEQIGSRGAMFRQDATYTEEDLDDLEDAPEAEIEATEETIVDQATAARTIASFRPKSRFCAT